MLQQVKEQNADKAGIKVQIPKATFQEIIVQMLDAITSHL
jgi:hypothetical protein